MLCHAPTEKYVLWFFIGPDGKRVPAELSCQLWLPATLDPETGIAKMQHVEQCKVKAALGYHFAQMSGAALSAEIDSKTDELELPSGVWEFFGHPRRIAWPATKERPWSAGSRRRGGSPRSMSLFV